MATTSYGSITIVDITDIGEFSVYPKANGSRTQIYNPDNNSYTPNWDTSASGVAMVISPVAYYAGTNVTSSVNYTWKRRVGVTESNISSTNGESVTNGVLTISKNVLANIDAGLITYVLYAQYTVDNTPLNAIGEIDFSLVKQGSTAKVAKITGENVFKYNTSGTLVPTGHTITLEATVNNVSISSWKYYAGENVSGVDAEGYKVYPNSSNTATLTVNPSDNVFINDTAKIKLVTTDSNTYDIFTITKIRDGAAGQAVISAVLTNEDQMIPFDKNGNPISGAYDDAVSTLTIYKGNNNVTSEWTINKTFTGVTEDSSTTSIPNQVKIASITANTGKVVFTCTKNSYGSGENAFTKEFSLVKIQAGADGTSPTIYSIESDVLAVNKTEGGTFTPGSATFNAYSQTGNGAKTAYSGRIQFYVNGSSSITDAYNTNTSTRSFDFSTHAGTSRVQAVLYEAGANTNRLDAQTVVVTSDGATGDEGPQGPQGISAVSLIIGNEADVIACTSANHPIATFTINIPFEGYQGLAKKVTNATTVPNLSAATWGTSQAITPSITNATTTSAGSITYTIPVTATVPESGQLTLGFTVKADGGDVLINKIYTWTRSSAAINGENAVILQVIAPDGTIIENGSGTLYAQGILYDGAAEATGETYTWYQYKSGNYVAIDNAATGSVTPGVRTGHLSGNTWTNGANGSTNTTSDMIKITPDAVDGYASFKVVCAYTAGGQSRSFTQYISVIDKSDPIQVSVHSTVGTQIVNGQGAGALYARVTRNGDEIDYVPMDIKAGSTLPANPSNGDYYVLLAGSGTSGTATLKEYNGSSWQTVTQTCTYTWSYRDKDNNPVTTGIPATSGQFVYIDKTLINKKITADVEVTVN